MLNFSFKIEDRRDYLFFFFKNKKLWAEYSDTLICEFGIEMPN